MKIGILTLPLHTNYGGILQAWALQTVLERMGHVVVLLQKDKVIVPGGLKKLKLSFKRFIQRFLLHKNVRVNAEKYEFEEYKIRSKYTQLFIDKYIHYQVYNDFTKINNDKLKFDAIVVGSDQIWRPKYISETLRENIDVAFLSFATDWDIKRLSYAASFGTDNWEFSEIQTKSVSSLIKYFDGVSVRELSGVELCKRYIGVDSEHVLDPTMLLNADDYSKLINPCIDKDNHKQTLFNYVLDSNPEIEILIDEVAKTKHLQRNRLSDGSKKGSVQPPVEEWLRSIRDSEFVITDSFHACVFCILYRKPFIVIGNKSRGYGRFKSLMNMFSLTKNLICDVSEYNSEIDYTPDDITYKILETRRIQSINYLRMYL
jgi:hypothetical protein